MLFKSTACEITIINGSVNPVYYTLVRISKNKSLINNVLLFQYFAFFN